MRILQISNYLYPNIGGIEQTARDIARALTKDHHENKILCFNETADSEDKHCKRKETIRDTVDDIDVYRCGCICKVASQSVSLTFCKQLKAIMNEFAPEVVVFHYPNPFQALFLMKYCKKGKFKFVLYWHLDIVKQKMLGKLFYKQNMDLLKRADVIVATSPNYIKGSPFLSKFKKKCVVIPSCISTERLRVNQEVVRIEDKIKNANQGKIIVFAVGRHVEYKGMRYLVEASKYLDERFAVYIGGEGELTESLKAQAANDKKVHFIGRLSDDTLIAYYKACDILAFPSITKNEAFGLSLAEGMYFGKPAVTFHIPGSGVNFVSLDNVTGIECPNRDSKAFAEAIKKLGEDSKLAENYGKSAKERVTQNFANDIFEKRIIKLMKSLK